MKTFSSEKITVQWARPPRQRRGRRTLERLLDAAEALIEEKGFEDVTIADIARAARSSVSAFYRRFRDKDALLHALHERFLEECAATAEEGRARVDWDALTIPELLSSYCTLAVKVGRWRRGFREAAYQRALSDPVFCEREQRLQRLLADDLVARLEARAAEIRHPEPRLAADVARRLIAGLLAQRFSAGALELELVPLSDERLAVEAARAALAYLGIDGEPPPTPGGARGRRGAGGTP